MESRWVELRAMAHLGTPMALRVAATLRLADHIAAGIRTALELALVAEADPDALERMLLFLVKRGVFARDDAGRYSLTELSEPLRSNHPARIRASLDIDGMGRSELAFVGLLHSIRTGEAAYPLQFGRTFREDLATDSAQLQACNSYLGSGVPARCAEIVTGYDWGSHQHVVDVGGGDGSLLIALLERYPALRGTVVDLPRTAHTARVAIAAAGLADRGGVIAGNFFEPLPTGADAYVLSSIIYGWSDGSARDILRRCAEAAGPDGRVLIVEAVGQDDESPHPGMDLRMLVLYGGRQRSVAELTDLAADAGLKVAAVHPAGTFAIVEVAAP